ncbi:dermonecrotic toxin SPH-like [Dermacentor silvarum]|uniref:dermonecrotic toxin SPH-like n=1 Tax=Dermacentor silvarum TaxID=543639 RepID=UPI002100E341|nr:dermonecrotic toxin SPH-like [Dermacentor silvarum]
MACTTARLQGDSKGSNTAGHRPFYLFGHMANSLADVDNFVVQGANAIEADLRFASNGTALKFYHGALCDCGRDCHKSAGVTEYLSYLRDAVNEGGKFAGKLQLLYINTKTGNLSPGRKYQAGINLANNLLRHLWNNGTVTSERMLNVILSAFTTMDKDILSGALDTLKRADNSSIYLDHVGFDISGYELLSIVADTYEELGIWQHRWQGDGSTNCVIDGYGDLRMKAVTSRRTAANKTHDYVDKAYVWTVDTPRSIRRFLRKNIDGIMTNMPANVLDILKEDEFSNMYRLATAQDSPWKRIV